MGLFPTWKASKAASRDSLQAQFSLSPKIKFSGESAVHLCEVSLSLSSRFARGTEWSTSSTEAVVVQLAKGQGSLHLAGRGAIPSGPKETLAAGGRRVQRLQQLHLSPQ